MLGGDSFLGSAKVRTYLVAGLSLLLYLFLVRGSGQVNDLQIVGDYAYLAVGRHGFRVVDVSDVQNPVLVSAFDTLGTANGVFVREDLAYLADGDEGLRVFDLENPARPREVGGFITPGDAQDVVVAGRYAYVADGGAGLTILELEGDRRSARQLPGAESYRPRGGVSKVFVQGNFAYLANGNNLRVVNISRPRQPEEVASYDAGAAVRDLTVQGERAYLAVDRLGMLVVDVPALRSEEGPSDIPVYPTTGSAQGVAVSGVYAYVAAGGGVSIFDLSDLAASTQAGAELGRFTDVSDARAIAVDGEHVFVADDFDGLRIFDAEVRVEPDLLSPEVTRGNVESVAVRDNLAFLASEGRGLRVLDISNPARPNEISLFDTAGEAVGVVVSGDHILLADREDGMRVLIVANPDLSQMTIEEKSSLDTPGSAQDMAVAGNTIYIADGDGGLRVVDFSNPDVPAEVGSENVPGGARSVAVFENFAYVAAGESGLRVIDVTDPLRPAEIASVDFIGEARSVAVRAVGEEGIPANVYAYVAAGSGGLQVIDVSDPRAPVSVANSRSPEYAYAVALEGSRAYVTGRNDGLWVYDISQPGNLDEIGFFDTPGEAHGLAVSEGLAYVAAYSRGLRLIDITEVEDLDEVGFYDVPTSARDVALRGNYAYLSDGQQGIRTLDLDNPRAPREVGFNDQMGITRELVVRDDFAYVTDELGLKIVSIADPLTPEIRGFLGTGGIATAVDVEGSYAYVADGAFGMRVINIADPAAPQAVGAPFDTLGEAQGIDVFGSYAFIADGPGGLHIVNVSEPGNPTTSNVVHEITDAKDVVFRANYAFVLNGAQGLQIVDVVKPAAPEIVASLDLPGAGSRLEINGAYLFVANRTEGVQVVYIQDVTNPQLVGEAGVPGGALGLGVDAVSASGGQRGRYFIYAASPEQGLQVLEAEKNAQISPAGAYITPGRLTLFQALGVAETHATRKLGRTRWLYFRDLALFGGIGFLVWLAFFAQFVLPLKSLRDRLRAANGLFNYVLGLRGLAIRIEDGKVKLRPGEARRRGPGVALLDTASAAMLRRSNRFTRPVGPGVVFTNTGEYIHLETDTLQGEAIDLHRQVRPLPPLGPSGDEDPFEPYQEVFRAKFESRQEFEQRKERAEKDYAEKQKRRQQTSGLSRDGVEVVPNVLAVFKIKSVRGEGGTQFGYRSESVRLAVTREGVEQDNQRENARYVRWYELPAYLVVDLWREYLSKFTLNELFDPDTVYLKGIREWPEPGSDWQEGGNRGETGLEIIRRMVRARLTRLQVDDLDATGRPTGEKIESREFRILEDMGIELFAGVISNLRFPKVVEEKLVQEWLSTWLQRALLERDNVEQRRRYARLDGEAAALEQYATRAARPLYELLVDDTGEVLPYRTDPQVRPGVKDSLLQLLEGTYQLVINDAQLLRVLVTEENELEDLIQWVQRDGK